MLLSLLVSVFMLTSLSVPYASAQTWYNQPYNDWYEKVYDTDDPTEIFGERYTHAQVQWIIYSIIAIFTSVDDALQQCIAEQNGLNNECYDEFAVAACNVTAASSPDIVDDGIRNFCRGFEGVSNLFSYNPQVQQNKLNPLLTTVSNNPVSFVAYFKDIKTRLKLVPEAQAQGFGFTAANPVLNLWRMVRNLTYFFLVLIVVAMAFMIMFRMRISPQTVITVQSALPRIVLALILITFSYAIAGFMIDLMYVTIGLLSGILTQAQISTYDWQTMFESLTSRGLSSYLFLYWFWFMPALNAALLSSGWFGATIGFVLANLFSIVILPVLAIMLLIVMLRIIWLLFRTFVTVLLLIIVGPIQILLGALSGGGFGAWLRTLLSHLAVYPTVGFMFVMAFVFLRGAFSQMGFLDDLMGLLYPLDIQQQFPNSGGWQPPLTFGSRGLELGYLGASFVIISMIPRAGNMIQGFLSGRPFPMGTAIGEATGPVTAPVRGVVGGVQRGASTFVGERSGDVASTLWQNTLSRIRRGVPTQPPAQGQMWRERTWTRDKGGNVKDI